MKHPKYLSLFSQKAFAFTMIFTLMFIAGASESAPPPRPVASPVLEGPEPPEVVEPLSLQPRAQAPEPEKAVNPWASYPNECDRPRIEIPKNGRDHYRNASCRND